VPRLRPRGVDAGLFRLQVRAQYIHIPILTHTRQRKLNERVIPAYYLHHSSMVSLCLNFRPARSAARKQNWLPYSSNSMCGPSSTVRVSGVSSPPASASAASRPFVPEFVPEPVAAGADAEAERDGDSDSILYRGTAKAKTDPCFGSTVNNEFTKKRGGRDAHLLIYPSASRP
jgi:hypothetical protein